MWKRPTWCWCAKLVCYMCMFTNTTLLNRFMTSQLKSTQPAEFMQYTKFQQFTRCIYENFRCAFTSMLAVKQGKIDWKISRNISYSVLFNKAVPLPLIRHNYKLTSINQPWPKIMKYKSSSFFFPFYVFSAKLVWKMLGSLLWIGNSIRYLLPTNLDLCFSSI